MDKKKIPHLIYITGTPGTGKTTIGHLLNEKLPSHLIKVNELAQEKGLFLGHDPEKGYNIVDLEGLCNEIHTIQKKSPSTVIVEGHLSHFCPEADLVVVLRLNPTILEKRLQKREYSPFKIQENLEAEALGICSSEAYQIHGEKVQEIDASDLTQLEVLNEVIKIITGEKVLPMGNVDFLDWIIKS